MNIFKICLKSLSTGLLLVSLMNMSYAITSGASTASLNIQNEWNSGYCAQVTIRNEGSAAVTQWMVTLDLDGSVINNIWNAELRGMVVSSLSYNSQINTNSSQDFGFCASKLTAIVSPTVARLDVSGGSATPETTPTPLPAPTSVPTITPTITPTIMPTTAPLPTPTPATPINSGNPGNCDGYATRFWDCCKPHCGWTGNVPSGLNAMRSCSVSNNPLDSRDIQSSCNGGDAHTCYGLSPIEINDSLSYGYAATSSGDVCGRCYQLDFTGVSHNAPGDPGSSALQGKRMIVQAINIGFDVSGGQFDILVPGGGVGAFNACSAQWGVSNNELGAQYGGFLAACKQELGFNASHQSYKNCLSQRCNNVFGSRGLGELQQACLWYADWFEAADNPALRYKEVSCPSELINASGMDRGFLNDIDQSCN